MWPTTALTERLGTEFLPFLGGQGSSLSVAEGAADLVADLVVQAERCLKNLR